MQRQLAVSLVVLAISAGLCGCQGIAYPDLLHPGRAEVQRNRAKRFDPYPESDVGPSMDEVRPPDFQRAMPEATRARWTLGS